MADLEYCVTLFKGTRRLGAGVLLTRRFVLTAGHCMRSVQPGDEVCVSLSTGEQLDARYCERLERADLALLEVLSPDLVPFRLFDSDRAQFGDLWQSTYTPEENDPRLGGEVADPARAYLCVGGERITALQLNCGQLLGDYAGYSGSPVERRTVSRSPALLGILLEQYPDRREPSRWANVLFAATILEAMDRFAVLGIEGILDELRPASEADGDAAAPFRGPAVRASVEAMDAVMTELEQWRNEGRMSPLEMYQRQLKISQDLIDRWLRPVRDDD